MELFLRNNKKEKIILNARSRNAIFRQVTVINNKFILYKALTLK